MSIRLLFSGLLSLLLFSCVEETVTEDKVEITEVEAVIPDEDLFDYDTLKGMYVGDFAGSDIRIILNYVSQTNAIGYNIHKGLQRNLNGKVSRNGDSVQIVLHEPGDHEYDGVFTLNFIGNDYTPKGFWESNSGKIPKRNFELLKMVKPTVRGNDDIDYTNFSDFMGYVSDTIGDYRFKEDGMCIFEYYPTTDDEERVEQLVEIRGTWSLKGKTLTIDWQPNNHFPERKMLFELVENEWEELVLKGEDRTLHQQYW